MRREHLADVLLASEVLDKAHIEADRLISAAQDEVRQLLDQATTEFWATAQGFLSSLEQQGVSLQRDAIASTETLLDVALGRLLDEAGLFERIRALVRNLASSQPNEPIGTLNCHPNVVEPLRAWLTENRFAQHWQLKADPDLTPEALRLSHASGAFEIDWPSLRRGVLTRLQ
ncbi:type III secretion system stator protein SctL [Pseudomonas wuhanensis]|uniref:Type III secretion system stator protein SctL n=1 Tax=Pseudomonas wuhanensis TaxID=2954098 RepID=A0ABY9GLD0_9PSED|nr:type III secretion system stator protein SctL [Pseudomonas sp. FP607]WLI16535.1 type III secretion system stator protein SctL [Pseudomonas sp. FP607]